MTRELSLLIEKKRFGNIPLTRENIHHIVDTFRRDGWSHLANGGFSFVLERGAEITKVFNDKAYAEFVDSCGAGGGALPNFIDGCIDRTTGVGIVRMERLAKLPNRLAKELSTLDVQTRYLRDFASNTAEFGQTLAKTFGQEFGLEIAKVCDLAEKRGHHLDLRVQNLLYRRSTHEIVITDPVCPSFERISNTAHAVVGNDNDQITDKHTDI